jgi:hypothetical protein
LVSSGEELLPAMENLAVGRQPEQLYSSADEMQPQEVRPRKKKTKSRGTELPEEKKVDKILKYRY